AAEDVARLDASVTLLDPVILFPPQIWLLRRSGSAQSILISGGQFQVERGEAVGAADQLLDLGRRPWAPARQRSWHRRRSRWLVRRLGRVDHALARIRSAAADQIVFESFKNFKFATVAVLDRVLQVLLQYADRARRLILRRARDPQIRDLADQAADLR